MRYSLLLFALILAGVSGAQRSFELFGESKYFYTSVRQVLGVSYKVNTYTHSLYLSYDKAASDQRNVGVGYQLGYTLASGWGIDATVQGRFGEFHTGSKDIGGLVVSCHGKFVLEEGIGLHYQLKRKFLNDRLTVQPFVRISFAQGFDQVEESENSPFSYECDIPLSDVSYPYIGLQYRFRL
ncbi:MAG: hypothetical protein O3C19_03340 [Bacteroidetes bacterium]|nr:hypothetical protein [Bacteroidota bacterium]